MRLLNSHRFGSFIPSTTLYDNVIAMYTLRRPTMTVAWTKAVLKVAKENAHTDSKYVFFDDNGIISKTSELGSNQNTRDTAPQTLGDWAGTSTIVVKSWIPLNSTNTIISSNVVTSSDINSARNPVLMRNAKIETSNGNPTLSFQKSTIQELISKQYNIGGLSNTIDFSILSVTENKYALNTGRFFSTGYSSALSLHHDTSNGREMAIISPNILNYSSAQTDIDQQRIQLLTHSKAFIPNPEILKVYYNNILQEGLNTYTSFNNDGLVFGGQVSNSEYIFRGNISELIISPVDLSQNTKEIFMDVNNHYQTY